MCTKISCPSKKSVSLSRKRRKGFTRYAHSGMRVFDKDEHWYREGILHFKPQDQLPSKPSHCEEYLVVEFAMQACRSNSSAFVKNFGYIGTRLHNRIRGGRSAREFSSPSPSSITPNKLRGKPQRIDLRIIRRRRDEIYSRRISARFNSWT